MLQRVATIVLAVWVVGELAPERVRVQVEREVRPVEVPVPVAVAMPAIVVPVLVPTPARAREPAAVAADPDALGPCPAPYRRATEVPIAAAPGELEIEHVAPSAYDSRLLVAWSLDVVVMSTDDGRSWRRVLDGDAPEESGVLDARFDCHGRLHVLRGDGMLGTHDGADPGVETWARAAQLDPEETDTVLLPDGGGVAVVGVDAADDQRLILARRDARGRWRSAELFRDGVSSSWDGVYVAAWRALGGGRFRVLAVPYDGGDCAYGEHREVTFDLGLRRVGVVRFGEEEPPGWTAPATPAGYDSPRRDAAGRWIAVAAMPETEPMFLRLDDAAWKARVAAD